MLRYPNIEAERARHDMLKSELSAKLGVTLQTYRNWMTGRTPVTSSALMEMSSMWGVSVQYLESGGIANAKNECWEDSSAKAERGA